MVALLVVAAARQRAGPRRAELGGTGSSCWGRWQSHQEPGEDGNSQRILPRSLHPPLLCHSPDLLK